MAKGKYKYWLTEDGLLLLRAWARDGLTLEQIAKKMSIALSTLCLYKDKYMEISEAIKKGKEVVDIEIENALYDKAKGGVYVDQVAIKLRDVEYDPDTGKRIRETERIEIVEVLKGYPPDTTAQIFWLKNRKRAEWRDKPPDPTGETDAVERLEKLGQDMNSIAAQMRKQPPSPARVEAETKNDE